jgi:hypothetical protein
MSNQKKADPEVDILEGKDRRIEVRVSDRELQIIDASAQKSGCTRSEYLRARGLKRVYMKKRSLPDPDYANLMLNYRELRAQGNNLNQIARVLNTARLRGESVEDYLEVVEATMVVNQETIQTIRNLMR